MYGGYIPTKKEVMEEVSIEDLSGGQKISKAAVESASRALYFDFKDTQHPDGRRSGVCALCTGNIIKKAGYTVPDDGLGNQISSAGNFWDQLTGHPYAIKNYDTEFIRNKEYENWEVITDMKDIQPGDVILFKGSGYEEMMAGKPTKSNPSGYHIGVSTSEWGEPCGGMPGITGGVSLVDDRGSGLKIWQRNKSARGMEEDFLKAARYV